MGCGSIRIKYVKWTLCKNEKEKEMRNRRIVSQLILFPVIISALSVCAYLFLSLSSVVSRLPGSSVASIALVFVCRIAHKNHRIRPCVSHETRSALEQPNNKLLFYQFTSRYTYTYASFVNSWIDRVCAPIPICDHTPFHFSQFTHSHKKNKKQHCRNNADSRICTNVSADVCVCVCAPKQSTW